MARHALTLAEISGSEIPTSRELASVIRKKMFANAHHLLILTSLLHESLSSDVQDGFKHFAIANAARPSKGTVRS